MAFLPVSAGIMTGSVAVPFVQGIVAGNPGTAGEDEKVQLIARATVADNVARPPEEVTEDGVTVGEDTVGAGVGATESLRAFVSVVVAPIAASLNVYLSALPVGSGGTATFSLSVPLAHEAVTGSPLITGVEDNVQLVALVTVAESRTDPPARVSESGAATNDEMVGLVLEAPADAVEPPIATPQIARVNTALVAIRRSRLIRNLL